jgi:hypothetical protein
VLEATKGRAVLPLIFGLAIAGLWQLYRPDERFSEDKALDTSAIQGQYTHPACGSFTLDATSIRKGSKSISYRLIEIKGRKLIEPKGGIIFEIGAEGCHLDLSPKSRYFWEVTEDGVIVIENAGNALLFRRRTRNPN